MRQNFVYVLNKKLLCFLASRSLLCSSSTREAFFERKRKNERVGSFYLSRVLGKKREERVSPGTEEEKRAILHNYTYTKHTNALLFFFFTRSRGRERERERECAGVCVSLAESESFVCSRGRRRRRREGGEKARSLSLSLSRENLENNI